MALKNMKNTSATFTPEEKEALDKACEEQDLKITQFIRKAVSHYIKYLKRSGK